MLRLLMANYTRIFQTGYSYYLTVVTYNRQPLLIEHIALLRKSFQLSKQKYNYKIEAIVILPDHFHMIITPEHALEYPKIIAHIKRSFVYGLDSSLKNSLKKDMSPSRQKRQLSGIWQKRYFEHTIRDEKDFLTKLKYMQDNPLKHGYIEEDGVWEYSSFYG